MLKKNNPILKAIERSLERGRFISYGASYSFIKQLTYVKSKIDSLLNKSDCLLAVGLYEIFLAGCYEKMEEIDDSDGGMGDFYEDLVCSWITARQIANLDSEETINQILKMMDNDEYGLCYKIEKKIINSLGKNEMLCFEKVIHSRFEECFSKEPVGKKTIYDFSYEVRQNTELLKTIYFALNKTDAYISLCGEIGTTPEDCENLANMYKAKKQYQKSLCFVNEGLSLSQKRSWPNYASLSLPDLRRELLSLLGRKEEALEAAWQEFKDAPLESSFKNLLQYVPKKDKKTWQQKAVIVAQSKPLGSGIIGFLLMTKDFKILSERILSSGHDELERFGYYTLIDAANKLSDQYWAAAAKIYRAMGMEIINRARSKHYKYALNNFEKAKRLYQKANLEQEWMSIVEIVRKKHSRKYTFINDFDKIVAGINKKREPSFLEVARKRWEKQAL